MISFPLRILVVAFLVVGCYRGTASLADAEADEDAAWLGARLAHPQDGAGAARLLVELAARGEPEARAVLMNRLGTMRPGPERDRLDAAVGARLRGSDRTLEALVTTMGTDERASFRDAARRFLGP
jgi:hypothetical protein